MSAYTQQNNNVRNTWFLIAIFIGLVSGLFYGLGYVYDSPYFAVIGLLVSLGQSIAAYFFGDKLALLSVAAKEVDESQAPQLHEIIQNLAKIAGIPKPKIFISPDKSANAFACGRDPDHANICLNQGILDILDKNELEGVIAHEMAHIKNRDILIMTVTMVLASLVTFITDIGFRAMFWGKKNDKDDNGSAKSPIIFVVYLVALVLAPLISILIQMAVSRSREYLADATAVVFTRYPNGLISALDKLDKSPVPSEHYSTATNHFFITQPKQNWGQKVQGLLSTHPPTQERIAALEKM